MNGNRFIRSFIITLVIVIVLAILFNFNLQQPAAELPINQLAAAIKAGEVSTLNVTDSGREITIEYQDGRAATQTFLSGVSSVEEILAEYGVSNENYQNLDITYERPSQWSNFLPLAGIFLPLILVFGFIYFIFRQSQGNNNQAMAFGKSRARMFTGDHPTVTFADVAGADEAKQELQEIVEFLKEPEKFISFGARIPKGVLLVGHPGTGKTLLAKAVSGEAGVPFFSIAGSEFVEMFVGVGASRVRDLFEQAKRHSPCIVFVDEIDAVGRQRGAGLGGSHDEREQTLNQILVEMDGFSTDTHVIILAATNRPDILDPALMRPGRFDRRVVLDRPDVRGREAIFRVHMKGKPIAAGLDIELLARSTPGFVGADLENTVNEAALLAARRNRRNIGMAEFQEAIERVQLGPERKSRVITAEERELVAYHEAGHAIVSYFLPHAQPMRKVTIIPRGMAGGVTWYLEDESQYLTTSKFNARIASALGGRIAEQIAFGEISTGAQSDLVSVTRMARAMVTQFGMSTELGLRVYGEKQELVFLGREISEQRDYSDAIAEKIDQEVRKIIDAAYETAYALLSQNKDKLTLVAQTLLEVETLDAAQLAALMEGQDPTPPRSKSGVPPTPKAAKTEPGSAKDAKEWKPPTLDMPPSPSPA